MVRKCIVCKKVDYSNPGLIFRRFPINPERRQLWISLLNLENQHVIKYAQICSDHFDKSDIKIAEITGRRQIKPDAEPQIDTAIFAETLSYSSDSTITETSTKKSFRTSDIDFESMFQNPECHDLSQETISGEQINLGSQITLASPSAGPSACPLTKGQAEGPAEGLDKVSGPLAGPSNMILPNIIQDELKPLSPSTETTETASESEVGINHVVRQSSSSDLSVVGCLLPRESHQSIRKRKRYINDLVSSDFSTPEKRSRNLSLVKTWDQRRRRKIHVLQMNMRRLKNKITSMQQLIDYLKEKSLITESSESTIKIIEENVA